MSDFMAFPTCAAPTRLSVTSPDICERVYAGVLGKIIGVYLGRPFEGWTPRANRRRNWARSTITSTSSSTCRWW